MRSPRSNFIAVWRLNGAEKVHLPKAGRGMKILFPSELGIRTEEAGNGIDVTFPRRMMACILTLES
jgi:hypothetical protein